MVFVNATSTDLRQNTPAQNNDCEYARCLEHMLYEVSGVRVMAPEIVDTHIRLTTPSNRSIGTRWVHSLTLKTEAPLRPLRQGRIAVTGSGMRATARRSARVLW